ncbi:MAG TPA: hypothetical protein VFZ73_08945, partial [Gemmatimonadaceae bacterium]
RDTRGRYYAAPVQPQGVVAVLAPSGEHVATIGRAGRGPGDLYSIRDVKTTTGDSLLVFDYLRLSLFSPSGAFVRSAQVPNGLLGFRFAVLSDGKVVVNNYFPTRPSFALLDRDLNEIRSFGRSIAKERFPDSDALQFVMAPLDSGRFIAVQQNHRFLLQVWDTGGVLHKEIAREPEWFKQWSYEDRLARTPQAPPFPKVLSVYTDLERRWLWISAAVADPTWRKVTSKGGVPARGREVAETKMISVYEYERAFDTVLEIMDLKTGQVIVSQRFDAYIPSFMEGGLLYGLREESTGLYIVEVWRPEVVTLR